MNRNFKILNKIITDGRIRDKISKLSIRLNSTECGFESRNILKEKNRGLIVGIFPDKRLIRNLDYVHNF